MCVSSQSIIINKSSYTSRSRALGASTLAHCVKHSQFYCVKYSRATPTGRELVCEYRPGRPGFKSSLLRMGGFRREVEPLLAGEDG